MDFVDVAQSIGRHDKIRSVGNPRPGGVGAVVGCVASGYFESVVVTDRNPNSAQGRTRRVRDQTRDPSANDETEVDVVDEGRAVGDFNRSATRDLTPAEAFHVEVTFVDVPPRVKGARVVNPRQEPVTGDVVAVGNTPSDRNQPPICVINKDGDVSQRLRAFVEDLATNLSTLRQREIDCRCGVLGYHHRRSGRRHTELADDVVVQLSDVSEREIR